MVPVAVKHLELLALGTRGWHELKAAHIAGFLGDRKILEWLNISESKASAYLSWFPEFKINQNQSSLPNFEYNYHIFTR
jgi:hypothetical protein